MGRKEPKMAIEDSSLWQSEPVRFAVLAVMGATASYMSVNIPRTEVFFDLRWVFGFVGFAILSRSWMALLLACVLSLAGFHIVPWQTALIGNMMYAFPILLVIRFVHDRALERLRSLAVYGLAWFLLILLCYQIFNTPVIWGFMAYLRDEPVWAGVLQGWGEQPFFVESLLVGVISALGMLVIRSNAELRVSRRELATTLYSIGDGVIATDAQGSVRRMNPVAEHLTGWREAEAAGKPLEEVFCILNEETHEPVGNPVVQVLAEGRVVGLANHTLLRARDGTERPIIDSAAPILDDEGVISGVVLIFRDQTEERAVQRALEESHARLLLALSNARMGIWDLDVDTQKVAWYGEHSSLFGIPTETFSGTLAEIREPIHPDDQEANRAAFWRTVKTGADLDHVYRVIWSDGSIHWMYSYGKLAYDETGKPERIVGTTQDITTRRQMEEERARLATQVHDQARRMQQILASVPTGVLLLDARGQILQANPVAEEDLSTLAGVRVGEILTHLGDRSLAELLTSPPTRGLWHEVKVDGHIFEVIARPVEQGAEPGHWVLVLNEVTREREIRDRLQQQDRLAAVGQLVAGIAHDFNNIVTTIVLYAQMVARSPELSGQNRERITVINRQAWHASQLIQQLLDFSRRTVLEKHPLDLLLLLKEQIRLLERILPENIDIDLIAESDTYVVDADPTRIQQMVTNLVVNARDAMPDGGTLRLELEREVVGDPPPSSLPRLKTGEWLRLTVSDTGMGIAPDILPRIFEPFVTTKGPGEGSGLGLAQVYGIVKKHGGDIDVVTQLGKGTTFTIYLPALSGHEPEATITRTETFMAGHRETILVVEDDTVLRQALVDGLTALNYRVVAAAHGREALDILEQEPGEIALVLSDFVMPEMGGQALFHALRQRGSTIPMVMLSGHPMENELESLEAQGLAAWMLKPPDMERLSQLLVQVLEGEG